MDISQVLSWIGTHLQIAQIIAALCSGGLAGAILKWRLDVRNERKNKPRVSVKVNRVNYSLPSEQGTFKDLKVSYDRRPYDVLLFYDLVVENVSLKTVKEATFLFTFPPGGTVVAKEFTSSPIIHDITPNKRVLSISAWSTNSMPKASALSGSSLAM
jgi:hypothetical protein